MEILFVWVDEFRKFKKTGFNFSSQFRFDYNYFIDTNDIENLEIIVSENSNYLNLFPQNYLNVTGIIGQNTTGKTSLLQLLKLLSSDLVSLTSRVIFCYRNEDSKKTIHTVFYSGGKSKQGYNVKISSVINKGENELIIKKPVPYKIKYDKSSTKIAEFVGNSFNEISTIFFSNSFDSSVEYFYSKIFNISTNSMVFEDIKKFLNTYEKKDNTNTNIFNQENPLINFNESELKKQIEYITFAKKNKIEIPVIPEYLKISFTNHDYYYLIKKLKNSYLFNIESVKKINTNAINEIQKITDPSERIVSIISLLAFFYSIKVDLYQQTKNVSTDFMREQIDLISVSPNIFMAIKEFILKIDTFNKANKANKLIALFNGDLEKLLQKSGFEAEIDNIFRFKFYVNEYLWNILDLIFNVKYLDDEPFLSYTWYGLSSGQEAFLRLFSRFYSIKDSITNTTLWILIDESELYFHPQWQKEFLSRIIDFFPKVFKDTKIQLFLTSHSPFVVSDLPKNNILFLYSDDQKLSKNIELSETFGSNIHTLYTNSFFLNGLIGDFAKSKIDAAINYLNNQDQNVFKTDEEVQLLIRMIGEPLLRNQLQKMVDSKKINSLETKYDKLEKRVNKLENKNKNNDSDK